MPSAALSLLDRCAEGPRYVAHLPAVCRRSAVIREAEANGWVTYAERIVTLTERGRRALDGARRAAEMGL